MQSLNGISMSSDIFRSTFVLVHPPRLPQSWHLIDFHQSEVLKNVLPPPPTVVLTGQPFPDASWIFHDSSY